MAQRVDQSVVKIAHIVKRISTTCGADTLGGTVQFYRLARGASEVLSVQN
jgi:hypothetical protein